MTELSDNTRDLKMLHDVLTNHKKEYYPNIQKQINVNVDVTNTSDEILKKIFDENMSTAQRIIPLQKVMTFEEALDEKEL